MTKSHKPKSQQPIPPLVIDVLRQNMLRNINPSWQLLSFYSGKQREAVLRQTPIKFLKPQLIDKILTDLDDVATGASVLHAEKRSWPKHKATRIQKFQNAVMEAKSIGRFVRNLSRIVERITKIREDYGSDAVPPGPLLAVHDRLEALVLLHTENLKKHGIARPSVGALVGTVIVNQGQAVLPIGIRDTLITALKITEGSIEQTPRSASPSARRWFNTVILSQPKPSLG